MTRPARLDPIVVPFDPATRQRVATLRDVPALHVARDPRDVIDDSPAIARRGRTLTEAIRAYADAQALDGPHHGTAHDVGIAAPRRGPARRNPRRAGQRRLALEGRALHHCAPFTRASSNATPW